MSQVDIFVYFPLVFWFIFLFCFLYILIFVYLLPLIYMVLKVRSNYYIDLINDILNVNKVFFILFYLRTFNYYPFFYKILTRLLKFYNSAFFLGVRYKLLNFFQKRI